MHKLLARLAICLWTAASLSSKLSCRCHHPSDSFFIHLPWSDCRLSRRTSRQRWLRYPFAETGKKGLSCFFFSLSSPHEALVLYCYGQRSQPRVTRVWWIAMLNFLPRISYTLNKLVDLGFLGDILKSDIHPRGASPSKLWVQQWLVTSDIKQGGGDWHNL